MACHIEEGPTRTNSYCIINALTGEMYKSPMGSVYWALQHNERCDKLCKDTGKPYIIIDMMSDPIKIVYDPMKEA